MKAKSGKHWVFISSISLHLGTQISLLSFPAFFNHF
ncbi:KxYKxGKxW signal peptide domain-containing protein [Paenibacillus xylanexedens]|nr:KxYKxGKxW signal peptide domain-containing protein [Paenibacillus xylanexedens]